MTTEDTIPEPVPAPEPVSEPVAEPAPVVEESAAKAEAASIPSEETVVETAAEPVADAVPSEVAPEPAPKPKRAKKEKPTEVEPAAEVAPAAEAAPEADSKKKWYVVKVASGQEDSIKARLERKIKVESLEQYVAQIVIPVERVTEIKKTTKKNEDGEKVTKEKRVIKERKKYPGYLMAEVEFNDQVLYLFRETPGVGDFVGGGPGKPPAPMTDYEVQRMLGNEVSIKDGGPQKTKPKLKVKIDLERGDKVRLRDGAFAGTEGEVLEIAEAKDDDTPKITVKVQFWGRDVKIDNLEFWQVDKV
ncbi:MAG: hypothetical protein KF873_07005 [Gemmataceae bacterium]|nr:hypothetical protein [Gemmataceae bacterium]